MSEIDNNLRASVWKRHVIEERLGKTYTYICSAILLIMMISITYFIASKGLSTFFKDHVNPLEFLTGTKWSPGGMEGKPSFGALPFIAGSFGVTFLAALISAPLGIGAAIFMNEIAPSWGRKVLQPAIELLVGIPSVVYGFAGLFIIVPFVSKHLIGQGFGLFSGMLVLAVMILPTITSVAYDAVHALPGKLKEASFALGATRWQTIIGVLVPAALPGLLTGVVLGMARAFGEALAVQMVIGNVPKIPHSLFEPASTLTSTLTVEVENTVAGSVHSDALWTLGLILLLMSFGFIILIRLLGRRRI